MNHKYLKKLFQFPASLDIDTAETVARLLTEIRTEGRTAVERLARDLDGWRGPVVLGEADFAKAARELSQGVKDDIGFAHQRVRDFARRQRGSLHEFETELMEGLVAGQKLIAVNTAGCYVPGGRYAHAASAIMSVCTAKVAGVPHIVAASPAHKEQGVHPAILYTMKLCGADTVLALGGIQAVAAMAFGLYASAPADVIVGPGNRFVAQAKRVLFGEVGIDVIAGPTESAIIADAKADYRIVAADLAGQAEHGADSPVWLFTTSRELGLQVIEAMPGVIASLPTTAREAATAAWRDYGEVVWVESREEAARISDSYAPEHLQVFADDLPWWLDRLTNYGSLFLGEETTVAYGDKCAGPNHILPTRGAARYSGGLSVGKFIKTVTYQRLTRGASREVGQVAARISRLEGMEGHARTGDIRLQKYFPEESFDLGTLGGHSADPASRPATPDGLWFGKDLSQAEPIPQAGIDAAVALMHSGRLHRYGEQGGSVPEPALLEQEYAACVGSRYCVALNSCGSAMFVALKAVGVHAGDAVLTNSFTLSPVPGAIVHAGARPVLVDVLPDLTVDLADLERKIAASGARTFLISHMRGHIADLAAVRALCDALGVCLVEDCAHTMGARWDGRPTGTWGRVGCYSAQTYKHINAGEGGLLVTDDDDVAAQAILMSGSYMMYDQHLLKPPAAVFERWKYLTPNFSMRMSNLAAALLRPQLALLAERAAVWNRIHAALAVALGRAQGVTVINRDPREEYVASSIQFDIALAPAQVDRFVRECDRRGLHLKWFGRAEPLAFTSNYSHWRYLQDRPDLPNSMAVMARLIDLRTPLSLTAEDCALIGRIVEVAAKIAASDS